MECKLCDGDRLLEIFLTITVSEDFRGPRNLNVFFFFIHQTLFVTWIRANLKVNVPITLWDKCLEVISLSTHWSEIITEWSVSHIID